MLVLTRKKGDAIRINDATITVVEIRGDKVRLGITAPKDASVFRQEVYDALHGSSDHAESPETVPNSNAGPAKAASVPDGGRRRRPAVLELGKVGKIDPRDIERAVLAVRDRKKARRRRPEGS